VICRAEIEGPFGSRDLCVGTAIALVDGEPRCKTHTPTIEKITEDTIDRMELAALIEDIAYARPVNGPRPRPRPRRAPVDGWYDDDPDFDGWYDDDPDFDDERGGWFDGW
jgi:hypothetical protein